jgi:hypothetical protein
VQELTPQEEAEKEKNIARYRQRYADGRNLESGRKLQGTAKKEWKSLQETDEEEENADIEPGGAGDS